MLIKNIESGSSGNSTIIKCNRTYILIDLGITYKILLEELDNLKISIDDIKGLLITHNHRDHTIGLDTFINKTNINIYIPKDMYKSLLKVSKKLTEERCVFIDDNFSIGNINIDLIHTSHDAPYSVGYLLTYKNKSLVYITDTGYINRKYMKLLSNKTIYLIESNHDTTMLMDGPYPRILKERIISDNGHLSNKQTASYLDKLVGENTKEIVLLHLSEKNNTEELALNTIKDKLNNNKIKVICASQDKGTNIIEV